MIDHIRKQTAAIAQHKRMFRGLSNFSKVFQEIKDKDDTISSVVKAGGENVAIRILFAQYCCHGPVKVEDC